MKRVASRFRCCSLSYLAACGGEPDVSESEDPLRVSRIASDAVLFTATVQAAAPVLAPLPAPVPVPAPVVLGHLANFVEKCLTQLCPGGFLETNWGQCEYRLDMFDQNNRVVDTFSGAYALSYTLCVATKTGGLMGEDAATRMRNWQAVAEVQCAAQAAASAMSFNQDPMRRGTARVTSSKARATDNINWEPCPQDPRAGCTDSLYRITASCRDGGFGFNGWFCLRERDVAVNGELPQSVAETINKYCGEPGFRRPLDGVYPW